MDKPPVPFDLMRMMIGDAPPLFLLEILFRTVVVYVYSFALIRYIGGRSVAQLSLVEFLLVIALGSAVGDSMFYPNVPLLHALLVITIVVLIDKVLDMALLRFRRAKYILDGRPVHIVKDGRILIEGVRQRDMGPLEVMSVLRLKGIRNLGQVSNAFVEASGTVSVFCRDTPHEGLRLVPPLDMAGKDVEDVGGVASDRLCCANCGAVVDAAKLVEDEPCPFCAQKRWTLPEYDRP